MDDTNLFDEDEARGVLRTLVEREHFEPIAPAPMLDRSRRTRRRRRWVTGGVAVAAVLTVSMGATLLPDLGEQSRGAEGAASPTTADQPPFMPLPGVPRGEAALVGSGREGSLSAAEATRRCRLRYPGERFALDSSAAQTLRTGRIIQVHRGDKRLIECQVPGDSRPSAAVVAAAAADPLPASDSGLLRNCSVQMWHDLTSWRIVARDRDPAGQVILIAVSPSGRYRADCHLATGPLTTFDGRDSGIRPTAPYAAEKRWGTPEQLRQMALEHLGAQGSQTCGIQQGFQTVTRLECVGFVYHETAQIPQNVARVRFTAKDGRTHDVTVGEDGLYAFAWTDGSTRVGGLNLTVTAYDAKGNVVWPKR
jgi:hypothetical protein